MDFRKGWSVNIFDPEDAAEWFDIEGNHVSHRDVAHTFDWSFLILDHENYAGGFECWVKSPEGDIQGFKMGTDWDPSFYISGDL